MSESFAVNRTGAGVEEFDRRRRALASAAPAPNDPLAELARLVGQDDPFRGLSPQIRPIGRGDLGAPSAPRSVDLSDFGDDFPAEPDLGHHDFDHADMDAETGAVERHPADLSHIEPSRNLAAMPLAERAPELSSDAWARGAGAPVPPMPSVAFTATREPAAQAAPRVSSQRTLIVLAAVVALTGGGLAASFLAKPSMGGATPTLAAEASAPTILAATGPTKVQPETPAAGPDAPSEPSTLLDKNKNDGTATAKVVDSVEQPVDLAQTVKAAPVAPDAGEPAAAPSPFPEPHKVKTILVRPDGSVITDRPAAASIADAVPTNTISQQASLAFDPKTSLPISGSDPAPSAAAPPAAPPAAATSPSATKSQARVSTTPKPPATREAVTTPAKPKPAPKPKPVEVADATPPAADEADATPVASGKFGVQLGAGGSDAEARDLASRLGRKYGGDLGGARLSVHKGQSGDRTVFRVRAAGLSQDAAKAVCGKVAAAGGGCFVVRD